LTTSTPGPKWGDHISTAQGKKLSDALDEWATAIAASTPPARRGPFDGTPLNGAEVFWLMTEHWCHQSHESRPVTEQRLAEAHRRPYDEETRTIEDGAGPLNLTGAKLDGAGLSGAWLRGVILTRASLQKADLSGATLTSAKLDHVDAGDAIFHVAQLDWADLSNSMLDKAHFEFADLSRASLKGSYLAGSRLQGVQAYDANLRDAYLAGTSWSGARLDGIDLRGANFDPARHRHGFREILRKADLGPGKIDPPCVDDINRVAAPRRAPEQLGVAWLAGARFDDAAVMTRMIVGDKRETIALADATYSGVNLTAIEWPCSPLGDERDPTEAGPSMLVNPAAEDPLAELTSVLQQRVEFLRKERRWWRRTGRWVRRRVNRILRRPTTDDNGEEITPEIQELQKSSQQDMRERAADRRAVPARANRQLSTALRSQGLNVPADYYAFRAYARRQHELWVKHEYPRWAGLALFRVLAGYGYRARNILVAYVITIAAFAFGYAQAGAVGSSGQVVPVHVWSAIVYSVTAFHGRGVGLPSLSTAGEVLSAVEAVLGLVLEATIVIVVVQRLFRS
jgi:uncharacterized protein YjbI with pentapeptide repeats